MKQPDDNSLNEALAGVIGTEWTQAMVKGIYDPLEEIVQEMQDQRGGGGTGKKSYVDDRNDGGSTKDISAHSTRH